MALAFPDPRSILHAMQAAWPRLGPLGGPVRAALKWASHHTGLPAMLIAALAIVVSWRVLRRSLRVAVELVVAVGLLAVASRLGWIRW